MDLSQEEGLRTRKEWNDIQPSMYFDDSVGPAAYVLRPLVPEGPSYSFPQAERFATPTSKNHYFYSTLTPDKLVSISNAHSRSKSAPLASGCKFPRMHISDTPGPGHYETKSTLYNNPMSLKGKYAEIKSNIKPNGTPGPGSYSPVHRDFSPAYSLGLPLQSYNVPAGPGPGKYNPQAMSAGPAYSIGSRSLFKEQTDNRDFNNLPSVFSQRAAILVGKPADNLENGVPGPGRYDPRPVEKNKGFVKFTGEREGKVESSPGPGEYEVGGKAEGPAYSFRGRGQPAKSEVFPGPGQYSLPDEAVRSPTLRGKFREISAPDVPGPGAYNPKRDFKSLTFSAGKDSRFKDIESTPGPADFYRESENEGPKYSFKGRNCKSNSNSVSPGPGAYNIPSTLVDKPMSIKSKRRDDPDPNIPGPGAYKIEGVRKTEGFSMGKSGRPDPSHAYKHNPGPGSYDTQRSKSVSYSFSKENRRVEKSEHSPGPGAYNSKPLTSSKSFSLLGKRTEEKPSINPGPGQYNISSRDKSPSYSCGRSSRPDPAKPHQGTPGPGSYNLMEPHSQISGKISPESKFKAQRDISPGPGAYDPKPPSSLSFSISGKHAEKTPVTPGPGTYEVPLSKSNGFSIGVKLSHKLSDTPGPGAYEISQKPASPSWTMKPRLISKRSIDQSPGPGQYNQPSMLSTKGGGFSQLERKTIKDMTPGPGNYSAKSFQEAPAFSLGRSQRVDFTKIGTKTPGPGAYSTGGLNGSTSGKFSMAPREGLFAAEPSAGFHKVDLKPDGPFYSIQGKRSESVRNSTPGPGAYEVKVNSKESAPAYTMGGRREYISRGSKSGSKVFTPVRLSRRQ